MSCFKCYDEEFKQSLINLYQTGKTQSELCKDYGVSVSALVKWIKQYFQVRLEDNNVLSAKQIQELQKRNTKLEEENLILKKQVTSSCRTQNKTWGHLHASIWAHDTDHVSRFTYQSLTFYYYAYLKRKPTQRERDDQTYRKLILKIYNKSKKCLGTRKIKVILLRD